MNGMDKEAVDFAANKTRANGLFRNLNYESDRIFEKRVIK